MSDETTADLLKRAALRLSRCYFEEVETERDSRWDGNDERADTLRHEAEEMRSLIAECRDAADRLLREGDRTSLRHRQSRSSGCEPSGQAWSATPVR